MLADAATKGKVSAPGRPYACNHAQVPVLSECPGCSLHGEQHTPPMSLYDYNMPAPSRVWDIPDRHYRLL